MGYSAVVCMNKQIVRSKIAIMGEVGVFFAGRRQVAGCGGECRRFVECRFFGTEGLNGLPAAGSIQNKPENPCKRNGWHCSRTGICIFVHW